jgi:hypothetical protein
VWDMRRFIACRLSAPCRRRDRASGCPCCRGAPSSGSRPAWVANGWARRVGVPREMRPNRVCRERMRARIAQGRGGVSAWRRPGATRVRGAVRKPGSCR